MQQEITGPDPIEITLTDPQILYGLQMGKERNDRAVAAGKDPGKVRSGWSWEQTHQIGCLGELAVMTAVHGEPQELTIDTYKTAHDVSGCIEVRTRCRDNYDLKVTARDDPEQSFVLVTCTSTPDNWIPPREFKVVGWMNGWEAQDKKFTKDYGNYGSPAYFVPQKFLYPMSELELCDEDE